MHCEFICKLFYAYAHSHWLRQVLFIPCWNKMKWKMVKTPVIIDWSAMISFSAHVFKTYNRTDHTFKCQHYKILKYLYIQPNRPYLRRAFYIDRKENTYTVFPLNYRPTRYTMISKCFSYTWYIRYVNIYKFSLMNRVAYLVQPYGKPPRAAGALD